MILLVSEIDQWLMVMGNYAIGIIIFIFTINCRGIIFGCLA